MRDNAIRIIGIDPGLQSTGWGVIDCTGNTLRAVASGTISPNTKKTIAERLNEIFCELQSVIENYKPAEAAIEESFMANNANSAIKLGMARGMAILAPASFKLPVVEYSARSIKKSITGTGAADKSQIGHMVMRLLPGHAINSAHAADALAIAICHSHHRASQNYLEIHGGNDNMVKDRKAKP